MKGVLERTRNLQLKIRVNFGFDNPIVLVSDSKSALAKITNDNGLNARSDICLREIAEIKEEFTAGDLRLLFINDVWNIADLLTKFHPTGSAKMRILLKLMETGILTIPFKSLEGRAG